jgi:glyceraldehyde-3-phosphate dehydrogenase/erythrose-4-phosphate dehydrogenase
MTTVLLLPNYQKVGDLMHSDLRRARAAVINNIN